MDELYDCPDGEGNGDCSSIKPFTKGENRSQSGKELGLIGFGKLGISFDEKSLQLDGSEEESSGESGGVMPELQDSLDQMFCPGNDPTFVAKLGILTVGAD